MTKRFKIRTENLPELIGDIRAMCVASDKITVEGLPVGLMYREPPFDHTDSGWRFYAGVEADEFITNLANFSLVTCNAIANHDRSVIPLLTAPVDSTFKRKDGRLEPAEAQLARWRKTQSS